MAEAAEVAALAAYQAWQVEGGRAAACEAWQAEEAAYHAAVEAEAEADAILAFVEAGLSLADARDAAAVEAYLGDRSE